MFNSQCYEEKKAKEVEQQQLKTNFLQGFVLSPHYRKLIVIVSHDDSNDNDDDKKEISCTRHDSKDIQIDIKIPTNRPPTKEIVLIFFYSKASKTEKYEHYEEQHLLLTIYLI